MLRTETPPMESLQAILLQRLKHGSIKCGSFTPLRLSVPFKHLLKVYRSVWQKHNGSPSDSCRSKCPRLVCLLKQQKRVARQLTLLG